MLYNTKKLNLLIGVEGVYHEYIRKINKSNAREY
jgi:hypothetical protein